MVLNRKVTCDTGGGGVLVGLSAVNDCAMVKKVFSRTCTIQNNRYSEYITY